MASSWKSTIIPKAAKSDGANALESTKLREVLKELLAVHGAISAAAHDAVTSVCLRAPVVCHFI